MTPTTGSLLPYRAYYQHHHRPHPPLNNAGDENKTTVPARMVAGVTTGAIAISCAQPTDVVKVSPDHVCRIIELS